MWEKYFKAVEVVVSPVIFGVYNVTVLGGKYVTVRWDNHEQVLRDGHHGP